MRPVHLGPVPTDPMKKLDWCVMAIQQIARASQTHDPNVTADSFAVSNVTETRTLDADATTLAEVADVLCTFIQDLKRRGQKGAAV